ncbi:alkaline phosphatase family protein [Lyngbya aestuarii]|uniref:alkaline phosphatase family protein n=1 Tax=Lyngbya aestuarii TaxID=118322 RepID=UPI00403DDDBB
MKTPVIAIGLDAAEPSVLEKWMSQGYLKNMCRLREQGTYGRLKNFEAFSAETPWTTFATGCQPQKTGYWSPLKLREGSYQVETRAAYEYAEYPPFYALGEGYRVAAFDLPQVRLTPKVNGPQVAAWGAHSPQVPSESLPASLFQELVDKHGVHPGLHKDYAVCLDLKTTCHLQQVLETGISRRSAICQDLLTREPWDLFLTVFGEAHAAGHNFWQLSQADHPLYEMLSPQVSSDPMLAVFQAIDQAIGEILAKAPKDARVVIFSAHGMGPNTMDLPSTTFLPEFLYRLSFPGKFGLANGELGTPLEPPITKMKWNYWERHLWGTKYDPNPIRRFLRRETPTRLFQLIEPFLESSQKPDLISPFKLSKQTDVVPFQPANWYTPLWPYMKAFALPSFAEGYIRINLQGREPQGIVPQSEYNAFCDELIEKLRALKDARTGIPMAKDIIRTRQFPTDNDPKLPDADLVIVWQEEYATDVVESPELGRIGPVPHYRSGSHRPEGFLIASGLGVASNVNLPTGHALDIPPTILKLMDVPIPKHLEGKPLRILETELAHL